MMHAVHNDITSIMRCCSRCHEEMPSYSWCMTCSVALCEFHHFDHKRSIDTSHHRVHPIADIASKKIRIDPHLPPYPCPDVLGESCSVYCEQCQHTVSTEAMMRYHRSHSCNAIAHCKQPFEASMQRMGHEFEATMDTLKQSIAAVKLRLKELDTEVDKAATKIVEEVEKCRVALAQREEALLRRLEDVASEKRSLLTAQLNELSDLYEDVKAASTFNDLVLNTVADEQEGVYLIAAKPAVESRYYSFIDRQEKLHLDPVVDKPLIMCRFNSLDVQVIQELSALLGSVQFVDAADPYRAKTSPSTSLPVIGRTHCCTLVVNDIGVVGGEHAPSHFLVHMR